MSRLFLCCGLCGRQQADGLLSRAYWGHLDTVNGSALRACPTCKEQHTDWESRLLATTNPAVLDVAAFPQAGTSQGL